MLTWFINIVILALGIYVIKDLKKGFCAVVCARILFPEVARFQAFGVSLAIYDTIIIFLWFSFLWNWYKGKLSDFEGKSSIGVFLFLLFYNLTSGILILFSADLIPQDEQFKSLLKVAFQECSYLIVGYYALRDADKKFFFDLLILVALAAGLYGIYAYMTSSNPYIMSLITTYAEDNGYDNFLTEARGALKGRSSGTLAHPLSWGQLWGILLAFYSVLVQEEKRPVVLHISFIAMALINIFLCGSRSALIATGVFSVFFFFSRSALVKKRILAALVVIFLVLLAAPINENKYPAVAYIKSAVFFWDDSHSYSAGIEGSNVNMRAEQLDEVIDILEYFPLGGMGYNSTTFLSGHPLFENMRGFESVVFIKTIEQGVLGFLCFVISLAMYAVWIMKNMITKKERILMTGYFVSYFASILVTGIQNTWLIFLLLPLLYSSKKIDELEMKEKDENAASAQD